MRITKIIVKKLFGIFDHEIPLNETSGITIVIGENGLGKTVILEAVSAFFGQRYEFFRDLEFEKFIFTFDSTLNWEIVKKETADSSFLQVFRMGFEPNGKSNKPAQITLEKKKPVSPQQDFEIEFRSLRADDMQLTDRERWHMEIEHLKMRKMYELFKLGETRKVDAHLPNWFTNSIETISVKIIETQRIISAKERGSAEYVSTVQKSSDELKKNISIISKTVSAITTELDSTYPNRLIAKLKHGSDDTFDQLNSALNKLDIRRKNLSAAGLIENIQDGESSHIGIEQGGAIAPLILYVEDSHKKLDPYEDISNKIALFMDIVNRRFKHKNLEIHKNEGFVFRSSVKRNAENEFEIISPSKLSSGEKNELILFYELIFNSKEGDLILIDEPELSLHISWQNKFISDLKEITSMNKVSIIIATHSPDIIDVNWDLKVELLGLE